jgi:hypothetical protein
MTTAILSRRRHRGGGSGPLSHTLPQDATCGEETAGLHAFGRRRVSRYSSRREAVAWVGRQRGQNRGGGGWLKELLQFFLPTGGAGGLIICLVGDRRREVHLLFSL